MFWKINDKLTLRFFERVETDHNDRLVTETGMVVGGRLHTIVGGIGSPLVSARDNEVTRPIMNKCHEDKKSKDSTTDTQSEGESKDTPPSEKTEGDTPVTPVDVVPSTEETPVDSEDEPKAPSDVETPLDTITRKGEEAADEEDDGTGQTFMD